jgi:ABC-2 type transport system ATP-binding protein
MAEVAERPLSVILSSHLLGDIERVCDHLIVLSAGRVQLAGDVATLLAAHRHVMAPRDTFDAQAAGLDVIDAERTSRQVSAVVRGDLSVTPVGWDVHELSLEDLVLAYLGQGLTPTVAPQRGGEG